MCLQDMNNATDENTTKPVHCTFVDRVSWDINHEPPSLTCSTFQDRNKQLSLVQTGSTLSGSLPDNQFVHLGRPALCLFSDCQK